MRRTKSKKILLFNSKCINFQLGFSIIEIIITISIVSTILVGGIIIFIEKKELTLLKNAQASIIYVLEQAQNRSATGVGTTTHGVRITTNGFATCEDTCGAETPLPPSVSFLGSQSLSIIFNRLTGKPNTTSPIILSNPSGTTSITVTEGGLILQGLILPK